MAKRKQKRRLVGGWISHISLVDRGAVQLKPVLKAEKDGQVEVMAPITKYDDEKGLLYAAVYGPEPFVDAHGDGLPEEVLEHYCHNFLRPGGGNVDVMHSYESVEDVHVAENLIIQKGDTRFDTVDYDGNPVNPEGWWGVVLKIENQDIRQACKDGVIGGVSMGGRFGLYKPVLDTQNFADALAKRLGSADNHDGVLDMDRDEVVKLFGEALKPLAESLAEIKKSLEKEPDPEPAVQEAPVIKFTGDPTDLEALAQHRENLFLATCDLTTVEGVAKWEKYLADKKAAQDTQEGSVEKSEALREAEAQLAAANRKVEEIRKASTQKTGDEVDPVETSIEKRLRLKERAEAAVKAHYARSNQNK